jgi:hypothetical protein
MVLAGITLTSLIRIIRNKRSIRNDPTRGGEHENAAPPSGSGTGCGGLAEYLRRDLAHSA